MENPSILEEARKILGVEAHEEELRGCLNMLREIREKEKTLDQTEAASQKLRGEIAGLRTKLEHKFGGNNGR